MGKMVTFVRADTQRVGQDLTSNLTFMYKIVSKHQFSENVFSLEVEAPLVAKSRKAGHFVIVRVGKSGERIPLTIAKADKEKGTVTLVVQAVGVSTTKLTHLEVGDHLTDLVGPLGKATDIRRYGTVVCAGGGVGTAPLLPIVQALKEAGNRVVTVLAGRSKPLIILEEEMRENSDEVIVMTDDGSYGKKGLVTQGVEEVLKREHVDKCFAIGPAVMMKFVCLLTKKYEIPTDVSLNTIMVDGTGMCGACRISVGGKTRFVCVDGPEFDGHEVDFDEMLGRMRAFKPEETEAMQALQAHWERVNVAECKESDSDEVCSTGHEDVPPSEAQVCASVENVREEATGRNAEWRAALRKQLKPKDRLAVPRVEMPELDASERARMLRAEVNQGLSVEQAQREASRCLDCANPGCVEGCPVRIDIPGFVKNVERGNFAKANRVLRLTSTLPAVCGRVCPQEKQCESRCIHHKMNSAPVAIGYLERFAADYSRMHPSDEQQNHRAPSSSKGRVAVVGSGPAGLSFAGTMRRKGYGVTVFEALHEIGGVLKYGIPEFRLPNSVVDHEIEALRADGVEFRKNCIVGKTVSIDDLKTDGFRAVFVASGAGLPNFMGIPGENATGIMSSNEYLTRVNLMDASNAAADTPVPFAKHVVVVGGGNTAMDSVRTALRLGAETATVVYRRSEAEMPARVEEVRHAKAEGVQFMTLHNPLRYLTDESGHVTQVELQHMQLGESDASGRRRPEPIPGDTVLLSADLVVVSIGVSPNPILPHSVEGLELGKKGTIAVNDQMQSSLPTLFAGGDIVRGGATVILAMGDGKRAAECMDEYLSAQEEK